MYIVKIRFNLGFFFWWDCIFYFNMFFYYLVFIESVEEKVGGFFDKERVRYFEIVKKFLKLLENVKVRLCMILYVG